MRLTDVTWTRDHQGGVVLELQIDDYPAYIRGSQKSDLLSRGIVQGMVFLASDRHEQLPNRFMHGDFGPDLTEQDLIGCTDNPQVFALHEEMCRAVRTGTWQPGPRPLPV